MNSALFARAFIVVQFLFGFVLSFNIAKAKSIDVTANPTSARPTNASISLADIIRASTWVFSASPYSVISRVDFSNAKSPLIDIKLNTFTSK